MGRMFAYNMKANTHDGSVAVPAPLLHRKELEVFVRTTGVSYSWKELLCRGKVFQLEREIALNAMICVNTRH